MNKLIKQVKEWFIIRNLHNLESTGQLIKLQEEVDELKDAYQKSDKPEIIDAVGDITVVLIGFCLQNNLDFTDCLASAYEQIKDRKGKMVDGIFVKDK